MTLAVMSGTAQDKAISAAVKNAHDPAPAEQRRDPPGGDFEARRHPGRRLRHQPALHPVEPGLGGRAQPEPALAKQGVAFGLPHQLSCSDVEVVNIFLEEKVATGEVDAADQARPPTQVLKAASN